MTAIELIHMLEDIPQSAEVVTVLRIGSGSRQRVIAEEIESVLPGSDYSKDLAGKFVID